MIDSSSTKKVFDNLILNAFLTITNNIKMFILFISQLSLVV